jgi:multicomponent Na+:H+ antiporter subunit C
VIPGAALATGVLFAVAVYLLLSGNTQRIAMGFLVLSNAANLFVITSAGLSEDARPPLVGSAPAVMSDPLPQAFLLTAIVIGLAAAAFLLALAVATRRARGSDELDGPEAPRP